MIVELDKSGGAGPKSVGQAVGKGWPNKGIARVILAAFWSLAQGMPGPYFIWIPLVLVQPIPHPPG